MKTKILLLFSAILLSMTLQAQNEIDFVNPPTSVEAGTTVTFNVAYKKAAEITKGYALVRFKTPGPNSTNLEQGFTLVEAVDEATVTVTVTAPTTVGVGYIIETQLFDARTSDWVALDTKNRVGIEVTEAPLGDNYIKILSPPTEFIAGTTVPISYEFRNSLSDHSYVYIRLRDNASTHIFDSNLIDITGVATATVGTKTLDIVIPSDTPAGTDFNIQSIIYKAGDWSGTIADETLSNITVLADPNTISMVTPPTRLIKGSTTTIGIDYTKDTAIASATIKLVLKDENGDVVNESSEVVTADTGNVQLSIVAPDIEATGYSIEAQVVDGTTVERSDIVTGISIEEASPYSLVMANAPTQVVTASTTLGINVNYAKDNPAAFITVQFTLDGNTVTTSAPFQVPENETAGSHTFSLQTPDDLGPGYSIEAKLFNASGTILKSQVVENITVESATPNTLTLVNAPTTLSSCGETAITFNFTRSAIYASDKLVAFIRLRKGSTNLTAVSIALPELSGTKTVMLPIPGSALGTGYNFHTQIFTTPDYTDLQSVFINDIIVESGVAEGVSCHEGGESRESTSLGEGYYASYYVAEGWKGPLTSKFGAFGTPSWIEFTNQNVVGDGHKEFDIRVQKHSYHRLKDTSVDRGYPRKIDDIDAPIVTTMAGQWAAGSGGKAQINMTAWISTGNDFNANDLVKSDIIVHTFDNGGADFKDKYDNNESDGVHEFKNLGVITSNGVAYQTLRTKPGYYNEVASYNLVPDAIIQSDPSAPFPTTELSASVDMKDIIDKLIAKEKALSATNPTIDENWLIHGLEWTVVGQSPQGAAVTAKTAATQGAIPAGHGKFTFNSYMIPDITDSALSTDKFESNFQNLSIYPNPFTDSFSYKFDSQLNETVSVELFTMAGRKIKTINKTSLGNKGTVTTGTLSKGMYLVRITSGNVQETRTLINN